MSDYNKHASVRSRYTKNGKIRTETYRREDGLSIAASTTPRTNSTKVYIDTPDGDCLEFTGRGARTLLRVLLEHFNATDKELPQTKY